MADQVGWRALIDHLRDEAPRFAQIFPQLPRLAHQVLHKRAYSDLDMGDLTAQIRDDVRRATRLLVFVACATGVIAVFVGGMFASGHLHWTP